MLSVTKNLSAEKKTRRGESLHKTCWELLGVSKKWGLRKENMFQSLKLLAKISGCNGELGSEVLVSAWGSLRTLSTKTWNHKHHTLNSCSYQSIVYFFVCSLKIIFAKNGCQCQNVFNPSFTHFTQKFQKRLTTKCFKKPTLYRTTRLYNVYILCIVALGCLAKFVATARGKLWPSSLGAGPQVRGESKEVAIMPFMHH